MTSPDWRPANEAERRMADALARGDAVAYFQIVATAPLFLPAPAAAEGDGAPRQVATITVDGRRHLLAFASLQAAEVGMGGAVHSVVATSYRELVKNWPNPEWRLALDPGSPIGVLTEMATVMETALDDTAEPDVAEDVPEEVTIRAIDSAIEADDSDLLLDALVLATVFVPTARPRRRPSSPSRRFRGGRSHWARCRRSWCSRRRSGWRRARAPGRTCASRSPRCWRHGRTRPTGSPSTSAGRRP